MPVPADPFATGAWYTNKLGQLGSRIWLQFYTEGTVRCYSEQAMTGPDTPPRDVPLDEQETCSYSIESEYGSTCAVVAGSGACWLDDLRDSLVYVDDRGYETYWLHGEAIYAP